MTNPVGLLYGPEAHHLDHLAPLCALLRMPLIITDEEIAGAARACYPHLRVEHVDTHHLPEFLVQNHNILFSCLPRPIIEELLFFAQQFLRKTVHTIWVPHGNSDKGANRFYMEALAQEEGALVYGPKMIELLAQKGVLSKFKATVTTGNFRSLYFQENRTFYQHLVERKTASRLKLGARTLLYAPTWRDGENSSFFEACAPLADNLPENCNLIIKIHPNLLLQDELKTEQLMWKYEDAPRILFLTDFAPIYPLLDLVDVYIGDMSSIGYDFLTFQKPLFFFNPNKRDRTQDQGLYLFRCGVEIPSEKYDDIYSIIAQALPHDTERFAHIRKQVYDFTFGREKGADQLREEIQEMCHALLADEL
jgi:hypothetical protein